MGVGKKIKKFRHFKDLFQEISFRIQWRS